MNGILKQLVLEILERHSGKEHAITGQDIAKMLGYEEDRQVRRVIRELIKEYPIVSSVTGDKGYYLVQSSREKDEYLAVLLSRLRRIALRRRDFKQSSGRYLEGVVQRRLI